jgi:hypothetical protein
VTETTPPPPMQSCSAYAAPWSPLSVHAVIHPVVIHPVVIHPVVIHPVDIHPVVIHPVDIHPVVIHPVVIHPVDIHPAATSSAAVAEANGSCKTTKRDGLAVSFNAILRARELKL